MRRPSGARQIQAAALLADCIDVTNPFPNADYKLL